MAEGYWPAAWVRVDKAMPRLHATGPTVRCRCGDPITRCDIQPWHADHVAGHGWIHTGPHWGHLCGGSLGREYARPWKAGAFTQPTLFDLAVSRD